MMKSNIRNIFIQALNLQECLEPIAGYQGKYFISPVAVKNLSKVHSDALTSSQVAHLYERAANNERIVVLAKEVNRHPNTLGAILRKYRDDNGLTHDFRSKGSK